MAVYCTHSCKEDRMETRSGNINSIFVPTYTLGNYGQRFDYFGFVGRHRAIITKKDRGRFV